MEVGDLLPSKSEISQASMWKDRDGSDRIHQYCIEIESRIAILAVLKAVKAIMESASSSSASFISELGELVKEIEGLYIQIVDGREDAYPGDHNALRGRIL